MADAVKETKAQRAERLKRELNPWEAYDEIERFAREGHAAIPPEWWTYFRWWGVYSQGDGVGAIGGKGGEGKSLPYLMVRIRIPNGLLVSHQLRTIADLAERYARGIADLTVRQNVQLHWVRIEDLPAVFQTLWRSRDHHAGRVRRRHPQRHRLPARRRRCRRGRGRLPARPGRDPPAERQPGLLQPAAQVQDLDHRLPRVVLVSGDQRRRADRAPRTRRPARSGSRSGSAEGCRRIRASPSASTPSSAGTRCCPWSGPSRRCSATATSCARTARRPGSSSSSSPTAGRPSGSRRS